MPRIRSLFAAIVLTMAVSTALAQTEVTWWHAMGEPLGTKLAEIASEFNESQDEYVVDPVYRGTYTEAMTAAMASFRADEHPHILQVFEVGTATMMAAEGVIYPVHELMADYDVPFDQDDYLPAVISYYVTDDGNLLSLPFNSSTTVLWYNQDALDELGLGVPETWDELEDASRAAVDGGYDCGLTSAWMSWVQLENYSAWHDLPFASQNNGYAGLDVELLIDNEHVLNHLQRLEQLSDDGVFVYGGRGSDAESMFPAGECVFSFTSSAGYGNINANADFEFGQTMLPLDTDVRDEPQNSIIGGGTLWVLAGHEDEEYEGVARFFEYLSSPEVQADWSQFTGYVPITTAAYELSQEQGFYDENPGTDTAVRMLSLNEPTENSRGLRLGNFVQIRTVFDEEFEAIFSGDKDAETALDDMVRRSNDLMQQFEEDNR